MLRLAVISCLIGAMFAAEPLPRPDIPDPFGLGQRLALLDHLKERWGVVPPLDASDEQLVAIYWRHARPETAAGEGDDAVLARDRRQRLRYELTSVHAITPPADADEDTLRRLLAEARSTKEKQSSAAQAQLQAQAGRDDGPSPSELGNLQARLDRAGASIRQAQERIARLERERTAQAERARVLVERKQAADAALAAALQKRNDAVTAVNHELKVNRVATAETRERHEQAAQGYQDAVAAVNAVIDEMNQLKTAFENNGVEQQRLGAQIVELDRERSDLATSLAKARPAGASPAAPATSAEAAAFESRLRSAVVLVLAGERGSGTGFFVSRDGLLVTNAHVVGDGTGQMAAMWDGATGHAPARLRLVKVLPAEDLALLRAEGSGFTALELGEVYDIARPLQAAGFPLAGGVSRALGTSPADIVVTSGTLNAVRRQGDRIQWLQHDCRIASGNSGGPLIDQRSGAVIGVNTLILVPDKQGGAGDGMNLAIPAWKIRSSFGDLITQGR